MKDEKAKYLIIDAMDINKQLYNMRREASLNDWYNVYTPDRTVYAKKIFNKHGVPKQFQKIIVKINDLFFIRYDAKEYTMGFPFDVKAGRIEKENNDKYISIPSAPILYDDQVFKDKIKFKTQLKYYKYDEVIQFLSKIKDNGYLQPYLESIKDFFDITLNLDRLYEEWNQKDNAKKTLTLNRKK